MPTDEAIEYEISTSSVTITLSNYIDSYHYLNDVRFVENYITYRGRTKSRKELLYELSLKGLDKNLVQNTKAYKENCNDRDAVFALILKRWGDKPMPDEKEKNRMTRYLAHRGFSANDIFSVYRELDI